MIEVALKVKHVVVIMKCQLIGQQIQNYLENR